MTPMDVSEALEKMLPVVDAWRRRFGEVITEELIRAYLSGVNDACTVSMALGAGGQHMLYERLKGN
jgi:hypothetical protein